MNKVINIKYFRFLLSLVMIFGACCLQNSLQAGFGAAIIKGLEEAADKLTLSLEDDFKLSLNKLNEALTQTQIKEIQTILVDTAKTQKISFYAMVEDWSQLLKKDPAKFDEKFKNEIAKQGTSLENLTKDKFKLFLDTAEKELAREESFLRSLAEFILDIKIKLEKYLTPEDPSIRPELRSVNDPKAQSMISDALNNKLPGINQEELENFVNERIPNVAFNKQSEFYQSELQELNKFLGDSKFEDINMLDKLISDVTPAINQLKK